MSTAVDRDELFGSEWDFLALDRDGCIAFLSSGGFGPIPQVVLNDGMSVEEVVAELRTLLPVIGESLDRRGQNCSGDWSDWFEMSRRGLYAYDSDGHGGPYKQVSAPSVVLRADDLAPEIARAAGLLQLPVLFAEAARLWLDENTTSSFEEGAPA